MVMLLHDEGKNGIEPEPLVLRQQGSAGGGAAPVGTRTPLGQPSSFDDDDRQLRQPPARGPGCAREGERIGSQNAGVMQDAVGDGDGRPIIAAVPDGRANRTTA